jgi:hypothetical protein
MKLTRKSKIVIAVVLAFLASVGYYLSPQIRWTVSGARQMIFGGPILVMNSSGGYPGYEADTEFMCNNGTIFEETLGYANHADHVDGIFYLGRLSPSDLAELRSKLGQSISSVDMSTAPEIPPRTTDVYNTYWDISYWGGGLMARTITYKQAWDYQGLFIDFQKRAIPANGANLKSGLGIPELQVSGVDCKPR